MALSFGGETKEPFKGKCAIILASGHIVRLDKTLEQMRMSFIHKEIVLTGGVYVDKIGFIETITIDKDLICAKFDQEKTIYSL